MLVGAHPSEAPLGKLGKYLAGWPDWAIFYQLGDFL
jgi:hypothetical protein